MHNIFFSSANKLGTNVKFCSPKGNQVSSLKLFSLWILEDTHYITYLILYGSQKSFIFFRFEDNNVFLRQENNPRRKVFTPQIMICYIFFLILSLCTHWMVLILSIKSIFQPWIVVSLKVYIRLIYSTFDITISC